MHRNYRRKHPRNPKCCKWPSAEPHRMEFDQRLAWKQARLKVREDIHHGRYDDILKKYRRSCRWNLH